MTDRRLRDKPRINYYEPEEPSFDEYIFCEKCSDYVFEYCAIHGPVLVIPDDKMYDRNNKYSHVIDAADATRSNWMRYVNCSRHWTEQNLVAYQYKGQLYYRTVKIIPRHTELLVFYGSEFANALHINLSKYNLVPYYQLIEPVKAKSYLQISTSEPKNIEIENGQETVDSDELLNFNEFEIIDFKSTTQNDDSSYEKNIINFTQSNTQKIIRNNEKFECDQCNKTFLKKKYLKEHLLRHLKIKKYQCPECSYGTSFTYAFNRHSLTHKKNMSIYKVAKSSSDLTRSQSKTNKNCYKDINISEPVSVKIDLQISTSEPKNIKIENGQETVDSDELQNFNDFKIIDFKSTTLTDDSLHEKNMINITQSHIQMIENNEKFECDQCHKTFIKKKYLKKHLLRHLKIKKYQCPECSYSTSFTYDFNRHSLNHKKNMSIYKVAKSSSDLTRPKYKTNKNYYKDIKQCEICNFKTLSKSSFRTHKLRHQGNVYQCQFCEFNTHAKKNLSRHNMTKHMKKVTKK